MFKKIKKDDEKDENERDNRFDANVLFGITEDKAKELIKRFSHTKIEADKVTELAAMLQIENSGELCYTAFLLGRFVEKQNTEEKIEKMFKFMDR